jgi:hypothetical protein
MKLFAIAFGIACGLGVILFGTTFAILTLVGIGEAAPAAAALAALPITAFPKIGEFLEQQDGRRKLTAGKRTPIYDFRGFQIRWSLMTLYGVLVLFAVDLVVSSISGMAAGAIIRYSGGDMEDQDILEYSTIWLFTIILPASMTGAYFVGRWIGTRCSWSGSIVVFFVIFLDVSLEIGVNWLLRGGHDPILLFLNLLRLPFVLCVALIGYSRGRNYRLSKYLHYLLSVLPVETRDAVVELAFDEAQKVAAGRAHISGTR